MVGIDPFIGDNGQHLLPRPIMHYLAEFGFVTLAHIKRPVLLGKNGRYWLQSEYIGMQGQWAMD